MIIFGILLILLSLLTIFLSILYGYAYYIFEHPVKDKIASCAGKLRETKYQSNYRVRGERFRIIAVFKHYSQSVYEFTVADKTYAIHYAKACTKKQVPRFVQVQYLKKHPWIACVYDDYILDNHYIIYAATALVTAICLFFLGIAFFGI